MNQSLYVGDTINAGRLTAQLSLRYDRAYASMLESAQAAIPGFPDLLPAIIGAGRGQDDRPRPVVAAARRHLRARRERPHAGARQLRHVRQRSSASGTVQTFSAASQAILIYAATDRNGNNVADPDELGELLTSAASIPTNPAPASTSTASIPT